MNKTILIVVIALALIVGGYFLLRSGNQTLPSSLSKSLPQPKPPPQPQQQPELQPQLSPEPPKPPSPSPSQPPPQPPSQPQSPSQPPSQLPSLPPRWPSADNRLGITDINYHVYRYAPYWQRAFGTPLTTSIQVPLRHDLDYPNGISASAARDIFNQIVERYISDNPIGLAGAHYSGSLCAPRPPAYETIFYPPEALRCEDIVEAVRRTTGNPGFPRNQILMENFGDWGLVRVNLVNPLVRQVFAQLMAEEAFSLLTFPH